MNLTPSQAARRAGDTGPEPEASSVLSILRQRSLGQSRADESGFDKELTDQVFLAALRPLAEKWFRLEVRGIENLPVTGPALIAGNHSGAIAVDALGADRVRAVMMPSRYTADISWIDAREMAKRLQVQYDELAIAPMVDAFEASLAEEFKSLQVDATEENIQARIRGTLLMALSNKSGRIVLTTGNKSEMAVGYCTLYGDMAGGFAVIKDVAKTLVYRLCHYRNSIAPVIPERIITRPPSAELRPDQKIRIVCPLTIFLMRLLSAIWNKMRR